MRHFRLHLLQLFFRVRHRPRRRAERRQCGAVDRRHLVLAMLARQAQLLPIANQVAPQLAHLVFEHCGLLLQRRQPMLLFDAGLDAGTQLPQLTIDRQPL